MSGLGSVAVMSAHENAGMQDMTTNTMIPELRKVLKRLHYPLEVMLVCALGMQLTHWAFVIWRRR
jgi:hypothetical protein